MAVGASLALGSWLLHISSVPCGGRMFGYFYEWNWLVDYLIAVPLAVYLCLKTIRAIPALIRDLSNARMIVDEQGAALPPDVALRSWYAMGGRTVVVCLGLSVLAFAWCWAEWWRNSVAPLSAGTVEHLPAAYRCSWAVAAVGRPEVSRAGNLVFGFVAFGAEGFIASVFLCFLAFVISFSRWVERLTQEDEPWELFPDVRSLDPRCGFQSFEPFVRLQLYSSLLFFCALFLVRLQYLFAEQSGAATWIGGFISGELVAGAIAQAKESWTTLFTLGSGDQLVFSDVGAVLGLFVLLVFAFMVPSLLLKQAAEQARTRCQQFLREGSPKASRRWDGAVAAAEQLTTLARMKSWPLEYPSQLTLLLFLVAGGAAFVFYKLTMAFVFLLILKGIWEARRALGLGEKGPPPLPFQPSSSSSSSSSPSAAPSVPGGTTSA
jgi:hypothetical protein